MKIFLTGITGYLGSAVADILADQGHEIVALVHDERSVDAARRRGARAIAGALDRPEAFAPVLADVDAVIHLAASEDPAFLAINERAVAGMTTALPVGAAFVMQGGSLVFGPAPEPIDAPPFDPPPFLMGRAALEAKFLAGGFGTARSTIVYGSFVYGNGGGVFPTALARAGLAGGYVPYPGDGAALWSICAVTDWAALVVAAATADHPGGRPVFASAGVRSVRSLAETMAGVLGVEARAVAPEEAAARLGPLGAALAIPQARCDAAARRLGWVPSGESVETAFRTLADRQRAHSQQQGEIP